MILISGCSSSYDSCFEDCIPFCMEGKQYKSIEWDEPVGEIYRATDECKEKCYNECRPK